MAIADAGYTKFMEPFDVDLQAHFLDDVQHIELLVAFGCGTFDYVTHAAKQLVRFGHGLSKARVFTLIHENLAFVG